MYEYDKLNDKWMRRASMLFAKSNFSMGYMNSSIYSFGGISNNGDQLDIVECFDLNENTWKYVGSMPAPFIAGCVVRYDDSFYIMGGRSGVGKYPSFYLNLNAFKYNLIEKNKGRFNNCYRFKPDTKEWTNIKGMNIGR